MRKKIRGRRKDLDETRKTRGDVSMRKMLQKNVDLKRLPKRDAVTSRIDVEIEHVRTLFPEIRKRKVLSRERGEKPILSVHRTYRHKKEVDEFELYLRGKPRIEIIKFMRTPPEKYKGFAYIILTRKNARKLVEALEKILALKSDEVVFETIE